MPLPMPSFRFVNVSSRFALDWIASSSIPVLLLIAVASAPTWPAEIPAAPPVDLITDAVIAPTFADSLASAMNPEKSLPAPRTAVIPTRGLMNPAVNPEPDFLPAAAAAFVVGPSICELSLPAKPRAELGRDDAHEGTTNFTGHNP